MEPLPRSTRLLKRVGARRRLVSLGGRFYVAFLSLAGLYTVVLLVSRLLGLVPDWWFHPLTLFVPPAAAAVIALFWPHHGTSLQAARAVDRHRGTKDLFLTFALLDKSAGGYQPLVARDAEEQAPVVKPNEVVPFRWQRGAVHALVVVVVLLGSVLFLPQLDPFGKVEAAQLQVAERQQLVNQREATQLRAAQLKQNEGESEESKQVRAAIEELKLSLRKMKPLAKEANFGKLNKNQTTIGGKWRKLSADKLKQLLSQTSMAQKFGGASNEKLQKWTRQLQEGLTDGLRKELAGIKSDVKELMDTKDPIKRSELARKLKQKLRDLEEFANDRVNSQALAAALRRAMKQMEMSNFEGLSTEALESLYESIELTRLELEEIAQSAKDLKALEEALKVMQMAKQLNEYDELDGAACQDCQSLADYAELYAEMIQGMEGEGRGMGNRGFGEGGEAPEDDSIATDYTAERSRSAVTAGKVLLSLKSKGLSDRGDARKDYRQLIDQVKQGVTEAILQEQIPPGYHEGIQNYFDSIDDKNGEPGDDAN